MNPDNPKLRQQQRTGAEQSRAQVQGEQSQANAAEFATVDDLLRFDSEHNPVPSEVAGRLNRSLEAEPKPRRSWFKKIFGS